jgi:hypothetical protein
MRKDIACGRLATVAAVATRLNSVALPTAIVIVPEEIIIHRAASI